MKLKIDFSEIRTFEKELRKEIQTTGSELNKATLTATTLVHSEAVRNTVAGVKYPDGVYEVGNLRRSLSFDKVKPGVGRVFISKGLKYPAFVEFGTRRMRPKPFLVPALLENKEKVNKIFMRVLDKFGRKL